jgi:hypothetical protein
MIIKALGKFMQDGRLYEPGNQYNVSDLRVDPTMYEVVSNEPVESKSQQRRKRQMDAAMKPSEVRKVVMRRK